MFTHLYYFPFLAITVLLYWLLPDQKWRTGFLCITSMFFIYYFDHHSFYMISILTITTYLTGLSIWKRKQKKIWHRTGIIGLVFVIVVFKYLGFLDTILSYLLDSFVTLPVYKFEKLLVPLGISYLVFKYISFLTDIYWGLVKPGKFINFLCYGSLFTIYVAGPIERYERIQKQLESKISFEWKYMGSAFQRIVFGLFKKLVLSNWIYHFYSPTWKAGDSHSFLIKCVGVFAFALQIYFDFSGYSDIAIGSSKMFGMNIMENFDNPYFAVNISQFWRKWHISLSDWIRDYLFFPLSQKSSALIWQLVFVPLIAMGLCGLWHGPAWHYVLWGLWHGAGISLLQIWNRIKRKKKNIIKITNQPWFTFLSILITFTFVCIGWVLFIK
jgi:alginate O-acetyltransferase complex protein AlgI